MKTAIALLALTVALLISRTAGAVVIADGQQVQGLGPDNQPLILTALHEFDSQAGEDKATFLKRVGRFMQTYSATTTFEACGSIWRNADDTQWSVQIATTSSHVECIVITERPNDNAALVMTDESIHSHPLKAELKANAVDARLSGHVEGHKLALFNATFSPDDLAAGPGYLIANRHLQHQRGAGTQEDLGAIAE